MMFDPLYWALMLPAMVLSLVATIRTKLTFSKYSRVAAASGMTGAMAARRLLDRDGLHDVRIEPVRGFLSDHYDPTTRTLRLSPEVYGSNSLSAIGVACHEAGHALQHAHGYGPLGLRSAMVPAAQFGSYLSYLFLMGGMFLNVMGLIKVGVILFSVTVLFSIVTLPVEWNASARARRLMVAAGIVSREEQEDAGRVLNAAFMTYLAAAVTALLQLLYFLLRSGLIGGRRDD